MIRLPEWLNTLRWRLLAALGIAVLLIWVLAGWFSYEQAQHEAEELMDGSLAQSSRLLLALLEEENASHLNVLAERLATASADSSDVYQPPLEFQVGRSDGTVFVRSANAPDVPVLGLLGYSDIERDGGGWRVLNAESEDGRFRVQVSHAIAVRDRASLEVASQTVFPLALIVPFLLLMLYLSVRSGLRPLEKLAADVTARNADNLAPLSRSGIPGEARPLLQAINRLFGRLGRTLDNERRFTADAAHELRTPLAALKVHTQVARLSDDDAVRARALAQIESGVDRATHLVEQLLRLARLDPLTTLPCSRTLALGDLLVDVVESIDRAGGEASARIQVGEGVAELGVIGDVDLLRIVLRNLLDNALRYSPADAPVRVDAGRSAAGGIDLFVTDSGQGMSDEALQRLGERFFRDRDNVLEGNGLGLAIVMRIAELHGARLQAENLPDGFRIGLIGLTPA